MQARSYRSATEFRQDVRSFLLDEEVHHNLLLGLIDTLADHPTTYPRHRLWRVSEGPETLAVALQTPPHPAVVARPASSTALELLASLAADEAEPVPGVIGGQLEATTFARTYCAKAVLTWHIAMTQGFLVLRRLVLPPAPGGGPRPATPADRPIVMAWMRAFHGEVGEREPWDEAAVGRRIDMILAPSPAPALWLWLDPMPVSLAGRVDATARVARIGPVYTPHAARRRGYASSLVAHVTRDALERGRQACCLFTDMANPTSNAIYESIGYRRLGVWLDLRFSARRSSRGACMAQCAVDRATIANASDTATRTTEAPRGAQERSVPHESATRRP